MAIIYILLSVFLGLGFGGSIVEKTLSNGVKLIVKETRGKGIVSAVVFFRGGQHGERIKGETHMLFTLLLKGSKNYPTSYDISLPFERYGGYIYSSSGSDFSEIGFSTKVEGLEEALSVLKDIIANPLFKEEDLEREKKNTLVAIRSKRERGMELAMEHLRKLTYKGTAYESSPLGTEESVTQIRREDLLRRWKELLKGENVTVALVGDIGADKVLKLLEGTFSSIPEGKMEISVPELSIEESRVVRIKREGTQATILCAFNAPTRDSKDYFAFKVLASVLGDGMTSKLFQELREKKGYAYATYAFYPTRLGAPRLFAYIGTSPQKKENALKDLIAVVKNPSLSSKDIEIAKSKIIGDFLLDHQTRLRQAWYLGFYEVMGFGWSMDKEFPDKIREVFLSDVKKAIEKYIDKYHCIVVEPD